MQKCLKLSRMTDNQTTQSCRKQSESSDAVHASQMVRAHRCLCKLPLLRCCSAQLRPRLRLVLGLILLLKELNQPRQQEALERLNPVEDLERLDTRAGLERLVPGEDRGRMDTREGLERPSPGKDLGRVGTRERLEGLDPEETIGRLDPGQEGLHRLHILREHLDSRRGRLLRLDIRRQLLQPCIPWCMKQRKQGESHLAPLLRCSHAFEFWLDTACTLIASSRCTRAGMQVCSRWCSCMCSLHSAGKLHTCVTEVRAASQRDMRSVRQSVHAIAYNRLAKQLQTMLSKKKPTYVHV